MKKAFIVETDISKPPVFQECIVCGRPAGDPLVTFRVSDEAGSTDYYMYKLVKKESQDYYLNTLAHDRCIKGIRNRFLKRVFLMLAVAVLAGFTADHFDLSGFFTGMIVFGISLTWVLFVPVPMEFHRSKDSFVFKFSNRNYAEHFASLNNSYVKEGE